MRSLRILFLTPYVPSPVRVRPYNLIKQLSRNGHRVTVLAVCSSASDGGSATALRPYCERVHTVRVPLRRSVWNCVRGLGTTQPLQALYSYTPALTRQLKAELINQPERQGGYDVLHVEHLRAALFGLHATGLPRVFDSVDCISRLLESAARLGATSGKRLAAQVDLNRTRRFEGWLMRQFDRVLTSSEPDRQALIDLATEAHAGGLTRRRITVLPNGVDLEYFQASDDARDAASLVYLGRMSYHANVTAVLHLVERIMPLVWAQRPEARLTIVGSGPPAAVRRLAGRHAGRVTVTGHVADVRPFLARATVSVSPLVYAVGIQNKVLESMAMRVPVVATPAACAALQARDGRHLLLASDAAGFAHQVVRLLDEPSLQHSLAEAGRQYVETHHDWGSIVGRLEAIYRDELTSFRRRTTDSQNPALARQVQC